MDNLWIVLPTFFVAGIFAATLWRISDSLREIVKLLQRIAEK